LLVCACTMPTARAQQPGPVVDQAPTDTAQPEQIATASQDDGVDPCPPPEFTYDTANAARRRLLHQPALLVPRPVRPALAAGPASDGHDLEDSLRVP